MDTADKQTHKLIMICSHLLGSFQAVAAIAILLDPKIVSVRPEQMKCPQCIGLMETAEGDTQDCRLVRLIGLSGNGQYWLLRSMNQCCLAWMPLKLAGLI